MQPSNQELKNALALAMLTDDRTTLIELRNRRTTWCFSEELSLRKQIDTFLGVKTMKISFYDAISVLCLTNEEKDIIWSLNPILEAGVITYTVDNRHVVKTTPGRFIKRIVNRLTSSEVKLFAELCKAQRIEITTELSLVEKAYTEVKSCMSYKINLLPVYLDAGLALAILYTGEKIVGRMLINPKDKTCNTGYGNYAYLARHLLLDGYRFTEDWLDGVAFTPVKIGHFDYIPYLDTTSKLSLKNGKFIVDAQGEYEVQPKTFKVLVTKTLQELYAGRIIRN